MHILHVNKFFDLRDGTDVYVHNLMERQKAAGHEPHILATQAATNVPTDDARFFVERSDYARREDWRKDLRKAGRFVWNIPAEQAFEAALDELKPDLVHLHNIYHHLSTSILKPIRRRGLPCVQTLHDYKLACPNYKMFTEGAPCERCRGGRYQEAIRHHCLGPSFAQNALAVFEMGFTKATQAYEKTVRRFICPSRFMQDKMAAWGEPPPKLAYLPNPVELGDKLATRDGGEILYIGRLSPEKGLDVLIKAAAQVTGVRVAIAGSGPEEQKLKALKTTLGADNVEFLGFLRRAEVDRELGRAGAFAVPSVWYENAPVSVLEAMAVGLPILASDIGGLPEMVEDGKNGWRLKANSVEAWKDGLERFQAAAQDELTQMGRRSRKLVEERFTWGRHLADLEGIYKEAGS